MMAESDFEQVAEEIERLFAIKLGKMALNHNEKFQTILKSISKITESHDPGMADLGKSH